MIATLVKVGLKGANEANEVATLVKGLLKVRKDIHNIRKVSFREACKAQAHRKLSFRQAWKAQKE